MSAAKACVGYTCCIWGTISCLCTIVLLILVAVGVNEGQTIAQTCIDDAAISIEEAAFLPKPPNPPAGGDYVPMNGSMRIFNPAPLGATLGDMRVKLVNKYTFTAAMTGATIPAGFQLGTFILAGRHIKAAGSISPLGENATLHVQKYTNETENTYFMGWVMDLMYNGKGMVPQPARPLEVDISADTTLTVNVMGVKNKYDVHLKKTLTCHCWDLPDNPMGCGEVDTYVPAGAEPNPTPSTTPAPAPTAALTHAGEDITADGDRQNIAAEVSTVRRRLQEEGMTIRIHCYDPKIAKSEKAFGHDFFPL